MRSASVVASELAAVAAPLIGLLLAAASPANAAAPDRAPWPGQYKLTPDDRLTPADVVGPDGLVYPDWSYAGVPGGIPDAVGAGAVVRVQDFGATPNDGRDDAPAVKRALAALIEQGGGDLRFGPGVFHFHDVIEVTGKGSVVFRGAGRDETVLEITPRVKPNDRGFIYFAGGYSDGVTLPLARNGKRGDTTLVFDRDPGWEPGRYIRLEADPDTGSPSLREARYDSGHKPSLPRTCMFRIVETRGRNVTINQPLRVDMPVAHGAKATGMWPILDTGVESLTIRQPDPVRGGRLLGVMWYAAARGWLRDVKVLNIETSPFGTWEVKWLEVRDCEFDGARHNTSGGGNGYAGFSDSWDCLMDGAVLRNLRHGPTFNGNMGCVIRNVTSHGVAASYHRGFNVECLIENCTLDTRGNPGGYEAGVSVARWDGSIHGAQGPRNVVWGNDLIAPDRQNGPVWKASALHLGGRLEGWIVAYNRFVVPRGDGVVLRTGSFDHTFRDNLIVLREPGRVGFAADGDECVGCVGNELLGNTIVGEDASLTRLLTPAVDRGNRVVDSNDLPDKPEKPVSSIFEWQRQRAPSPGG